MYSVASFLTVSAAVAAPPRMQIGRGRISGTLVALIYSAIAAPLIYVSAGFQLDSTWLVATTASFLFALLGGLVGDFFVLKQDVLTP
jgi:hypothetical protein